MGLGPFFVSRRRRSGARNQRLMAERKGVGVVVVGSASMWGPHWLYARLGCRPGRLRTRSLAPQAALSHPYLCKEEQVKDFDEAIIRIAISLPRPKSQDRAERKRYKVQVHQNPNGCLRAALVHTTDFLCRSSRASGRPAARRAPDLGSPVGTADAPSTESTCTIPESTASNGQRQACEMLREETAPSRYYPPHDTTFFKRASKKGEVRAKGGGDRISIAVRNWKFHQRVWRFHFHRRRLGTSSSRA